MWDFKKSDGWVNAVAMLFVPALLSLDKVFEGKKTFVEWLVWIPLYAIVFALFFCGIRLGRRLQGVDNVTLWRCLADVIGCVGLGYLYVTTFKVGKCTPLLWIGAALTLSALGIAMGAFQARKKAIQSEATT